MLTREKSWWPIVAYLAFSLTRWPGWIPSEWQNFSAAYALAFCGGAFLPRSLAWWLPLGTTLVTEMMLNRYYGFPIINGYTIVNLFSYGILIGLGRWMGSRASMVSLLGGSLLGAILFYLVTNSFSWLRDPAYMKSLSGWIQALTRGSEGWPETWKFFRNTMLSTGLFSMLFAFAAKSLSSAESPVEKGESTDGEEPASEEARSSNRWGSNAGHP